MNDYTLFPEGLPVPEDDGKASHLLGRQIPEITMPSTKNNFFDFSAIDKKIQYCIFFL